MREKRIVLKLGDICSTKVKYENEDTLILCFRGAYMRGDDGCTKCVSTSAYVTLELYVTMLLEQLGLSLDDINFELTLKEFENYEVVRRGFISAKELLLLISSKLTSLKVRCTHRCNLDGILLDTSRLLMFNKTNGGASYYITLDTFELTYGTDAKDNAKVAPTKPMYPNMLQPLKVKDNTWKPREHQLLDKIYKIYENTAEHIIIEIKALTPIEQLQSPPYFNTYRYIKITKGEEHICTLMTETGQCLEYHWGRRSSTHMSTELRQKHRLMLKNLELRGIALQLTAPTYTTCGYYNTPEGWSLHLGVNGKQAGRIVCNSFEEMNNIVSSNYNFKFISLEDNNLVDKVWRYSITPK